jgi:hypothetical protein
MRREYPQMREMLERTWKMLERAPVKVSDDMKTAYKKLMQPDDGHDWQPKQEAKAWGATSGLYKPAKKEGADKPVKKEGADKPVKKEGADKPMKKDVKMADDDVKSTDPECGTDAAARDAMEISACKLTASNVLAGSNRKHSPPPPSAPKKPKFKATDEELAMHDLPTKDRANGKPIVAASDHDNRKHLPPPSGSAKKAKLKSFKKTRTSTDTFWQSRIHLTATE